MGNNPVTSVDPDGGFACCSWAELLALADKYAVTATRLPALGALAGAAVVGASNVILRDGFKTWTTEGLKIEPNMGSVNNYSSSSYDPPPNDYYRGAPSTAGIESPSAAISPPGTLESMIPIWGSGREAAAAFSAGNYWTGAAYTALAISDVFLVKSIATGLARGAWKLGAHGWKVTRSWYGRSYELAKGTQVHHWAIPQKTIEKYGWQSWANQPWNLKPIMQQGSFNSLTVHLAIHGKSRSLYFNTGQRLWYGTPTWVKAGTISIGGRAPGALND